MIFNSLEFAIFLPIVFGIYWFLLGKDHRKQNVFLVGASFLFYGWWDWRFLFLLIFSAGIDYLVGIGIEQSTSQKKRRLLLWLSLIANLGILCFFKYFNFFIESFSTAFTFFGQHVSSGRLDIVLPVGVSFYTFQALSYSVDVYRGRLKATRHPVTYFAFISFFPQLVAGPIERASNLLGQFAKRRVFDRSLAVEGMRQILWGLFKKIVIADSCAHYVDIIFDNSANYNGSTLLLGAVLFAFQIYGDFSGYSDIAIGVSKLFGFKLMRNFNFPYFSRDIAEFWRRWHISLSTWFRDYIYIPLGGSRGTMLVKIRNIFVIFVLSGLWHGANWTFVAWGLLNAVYFIPSMLLKQNRVNIEIVAIDRNLPTIKEFLSISFTFILTCLAWIFFRSDSISQSLDIFTKIFSPSLLYAPYFPTISTMLSTVILIVVFVLIEWIGRRGEYGLSFVDKMKSPLLRLGVYYMVSVTILTQGSFDNNQFIYFQF